MEIRDQVTKYVEQRIQALRRQHAPSGAAPTPGSNASTPRPDGTDAAECQLESKDVSELIPAGAKPAGGYVGVVARAAATQATLREPPEVGPDLTAGASMKEDGARPGPYQNATAIRANTMKFMCNYFRKGQLTKMFFLFPDPHFKAANHRCDQTARGAVTQRLCCRPRCVTRPTTRGLTRLVGARGHHRGAASLHCMLVRAQHLAPAHLQTLPHSFAYVLRKRHCSGRGGNARLHMRCSVTWL